MNLATTRRKFVTLSCVLLWLFSTQVKAATTPGDYHLLVITGLGGEAFYAQLFNRWASTMTEVASDQLGIRADNIVWLGEQKSDSPQAMTGESRRESILAALDALTTNSDPGDTLLIVLIGHGSASRDRALFNLPGPDISAEDLRLALEPLVDRQVALVNTAPASAPFIQALTHTDRIVITATANGRENHHTQFASGFVSAWIDDSADRDKDKRVSLLEAFNFAKAQTTQYYESDGRLQTEHALLDDNADGVGSREPTASASATVDGDGNPVDGILAHRFFFDPANLNPDSIEQDPTLTRARLELTVDARQLLDRVERLKRKKNVLPVDDYNQQLEDLLVELALNRRAWRNLEPD